MSGRREKQPQSCRKHRQRRGYSCVVCDSLRTIDRKRSSFPRVPLVELLCRFEAFGFSSPSSRKHRKLSRIMSSSPATLGRMPTAAPMTSTLECVPSSTATLLPKDRYVPMDNVAVKGKADGILIDLCQPATDAHSNDCSPISESTIAMENYTSDHDVVNNINTTNNTNNNNNNTIKFRKRKSIVEDALNVEPSQLSVAKELKVVLSRRSHARISLY